MLNRTRSWWFDMYFLCIISDEMCEKVIDVDGEAAAVILLDTWDTEVRGRSIFGGEEGTSAWMPVCILRYTVPNSLCVFQTDDQWAQECYMQTGDAYLLLYSITDRASFLRASELRINLRRFRPAQHTPIILVGNKCDLVRRREVSVNGEKCNTCLFCLKSTVSFSACIFKLCPFWLFQRAVPVLLCLTASLLKPQPPCSTTSGKPSMASCDSCVCGETPRRPTNVAGT